jgi:hypothetical protein
VAVEIDLDEIIGADVHLRHPGGRHQNAIARETHRHVSIRTGDEAPLPQAATDGDDLAPSGERP